MTRRPSANPNPASRSVSLTRHQATRGISASLSRATPHRDGRIGQAPGTWVTGPLSQDSVDFIILSPPWLGVTLVAATALLFGMTFTALAARLDATLPSLRRPWSALSWRHRLAYASLICLLIPVLALPAGLYIAGRAASHGRLGSLLDNGPLRQAGRVMAAVVTIVALAMVVGRPPESSEHRRAGLIERAPVSRTMRWSRRATCRRRSRRAPGRPRADPTGRGPCRREGGGCAPHPARSMRHQGGWPSHGAPRRRGRRRRRCS